MWMPKDTEGRERYACRTCGRTKVFIFKEPMGRKPKSSGSRVRITVQCANCKKTPKRVGWHSHG